METVFIITYEQAKIAFVVGFSRLVRLKGRWLHCYGFFTRHIVRISPKGPFECRSNLERLRRLDGERYTFHPVAHQVWMDINPEEAFSAAKLCDEMTIILPGDGFRRM